MAPWRVPTHVTDGDSTWITVNWVVGQRVTPCRNAACFWGSSPRSMRTLPPVIRSNSCADWNVRVFCPYVFAGCAPAPTETATANSAHEQAHHAQGLQVGICRLPGSGFGSQSLPLGGLGERVIHAHGDHDGRDAPDGGPPVAAGDQVVANHGRRRPR